MKTPANRAADLNFRILLQKNLEERAEKNPRYSIRSFARFLKINDSTLSQVLRGKRRLSPAQMNRALDKLGLEKLSAVRAGADSAAFATLPMASFDIDTWVDDAILELTRLSTFQANARWIARTLAVTVPETNSALERLEKLGYIDRSQPRWKNKLADSTNVVEGGYTNESLKRYQRLLLERSSRALNESQREERDHSSLILAIDPDDMPEIKQRIKDFRRELLAFVEKPGAKPARIAALQVSFFPLTEIEPNGDDQ